MSRRPLPPDTRHATRTILFLECLEDRRMLAGGDAGDTLAAAKPLGRVADAPLGAVDAIHSLVGPNIDVDIFAFDATAGQRMTITCDPPAGEDDFTGSPILRLFNADGRELTKTVLNVPLIADFTIPAEGRYFVGVSEESNSDYDPLSAESRKTVSRAFAYALIVKDTSPKDPAVFEGRIGPDQPKFFRAVTLSQPAMLDATVVATEGAFLQPAIRLQDEAGSLIGTATATGGREVRVQQILQAGTYVIGVTSADGSAGNFTGRIVVSPRVNPADGLRSDPDNPENSSRTCVAEDIDGDGFRDLVVAAAGNGTILPVNDATPRRTFLSVFRGTGDGAFLPPIRVSLGGQNHPGTQTALAVLEDAFDGVGAVQGLKPWRTIAVAGVRALVDSNQSVVLQTTLTLVTISDSKVRLSVTPVITDPAPEGWEHVEAPNVALASVSKAPGVTEITVASGGKAVTLDLTAMDSGVSLSVPSGPQPNMSATISDLAYADVDNDGRPDLLMTDRKQNRVLVYRRNQNGAIDVTHWRQIEVGAAPTAIACRDLDRDGRVDVVTSNFLDVGAALTGVGGVSVCWNRGDGAFAVVNEAVGGGPTGLVISDVDKDGNPDILTANQYTNDVSVLLAKPDRVSAVVARPSHSFRPFTSTYAGLACGGLAAADVDSDGNDDVVVVDYLPPLFLMNEATGERTSVRYPQRRVADAAILFGRGDGTFDVPYQRTLTGAAPVAVAAGDVSGDGRPDLVTANFGSGDLSVMLGKGDGTFETGMPISLRTAAKPVDTGSIRCPVSVSIADVNGDGRQDVAVACVDITLAEFSTLLREGRKPDTPSSRLLVFYGLGDGTFDRSPTRVVPLSGKPQALVAADLSEDGAVSLVTAEEGDGSGGRLSMVSAADSVDVERYSLPGKLPTAVATGMVDGSPAIIVTVVPADKPEAGEGHVLILEGDPLPGNGWRERALPISVGLMPRAVKLNDLDGDGHVDIIALASKSNRITIFWGGGKIPFSQTHAIDAGDAPVSVDVIKVGGRTALVTANHGTSDVSVIVQDPSDPRKFAPAGSRAIFDGASAATAGDFDGDGRQDLAIPDGRNGVSIVLGGKSGLFPVFGSSVSNAPAASVNRANLGARATLDTFTIDRSGQVRIRYDADSTPRSLRLPGPLMLGSQGTAFDAAPLATPSGPVRLAAIDYGREKLFIASPTPEDEFLVQMVLAAAGPSSPADPNSVLSRIARAVGTPGAATDRLGDLNGDGYGDIVVSNPGTGTIDILLSASDGRFDDRMWQRLPAGIGPIGVFLIDIDTNGVADIIAANQVSGDISVRLGVKGSVGTATFSAATGFGAEFRFRMSSRVAGYGIDPYSGRGSAIDPRKLSDMALSDVDGDGLVDVVATSAQDRAFAILRGLRGSDGRWGGFGSPERHAVQATAGDATTSGGESARVEDVVLGDVDRDGQEDIVLLDRVDERILVFPSRSRAGFAGLPVELSLTGVTPTSLQVDDVTGPQGVADGMLDLVVGNDFGDVFTLEGIGDGGFEPPRSSRFSTIRTDQSVALVAADVDGDGQQDFIYGNKGLDRVVVARGVNEEMFAADRRQGLVAPSGVVTVEEKFGGRTLRNLVVTNGGGNQILVFRNAAGFGGAQGEFLEPETFFVGTNPSALAVGDVDKDGIPDVVVANEGSDDISVMLGTNAADGRWTLRAGVRLSAGGKSPAGIAVGDFVKSGGTRGADGIPDIAVTNRGSDSANIIAGLSGGFFNDRSVVPLVLPPDAGPGPIVTTPGGIVIGNNNLGGFTVVNTGMPGRAGELFEFRNYFIGGSGAVALATATRAGTTFLAVGNAGTGSVSQFLARQGSIDFKFDKSTSLLDVTGLAYNPKGLFGVSPGQSALELFAFDGRSAERDAGNVQLNTLRNAAQFVTVRFSAVAVVATVATLRLTGGTPTAAKAAEQPVAQDAKADATDGGSTGAEKPEGDGPKTDAAEPAGKEINDAVNDSGLLDGFFGSQLEAENEVARASAELLRLLMADTAQPPTTTAPAGQAAEPIPPSKPAAENAPAVARPAPGSPSDALRDAKPTTPAADRHRPGTSELQSKPISNGGLGLVGIWSAGNRHATRGPIFDWFRTPAATSSARRKRSRPRRSNPPPLQLPFSSRE